MDDTANTDRAEHRDDIPGWEALNLGERIVAVARRLAHEDVSMQLEDCCRSDVDEEDEAAADPLLLSLAVASRTLEAQRRRTRRAA
ncbi:MAG: hypothetical protein AAF743_13740 [Planctomycetota bacterium]